jgi:hypothetical protein
MRKKGDNSCVKLYEENQTKKITLFCLKNSLYLIGAMLLTPNKFIQNPYKSKQNQTCLANSTHNTSHFKGIGSTPKNVKLCKPFHTKKFTVFD